MSQKSFEDIENKIREAAANSEPAFDEQAWLKMELMLNKEERKKRGLFIWWRFGLPLLLIGLGLSGYWHFNNPPIEKTTAGIVTATTTSTTNNERNPVNPNKVELDVEQKNKAATVTEKTISGEAVIQSKDAGPVNNETSDQHKKSIPRQQDVKDDHLAVANTLIAKKVKLQKKGSAITYFNGSGSLFLQLYFFCN